MGGDAGRLLDAARRCEGKSELTLTDSLDICPSAERSRLVEEEELQQHPLHGGAIGTTGATRVRFRVREDLSLLQQRDGTLVGEEATSHTPDEQTKTGELGDFVALRTVLPSNTCKIPVILPGDILTCGDERVACWPGAPCWQRATRWS